MLPPSQALRFIYRYEKCYPLLQLCDALLVELDGGGLPAQAGHSLVNVERLADKPESILLVRRLGILDAAKRNHKEAKQIILSPPLKKKFAHF